MVALALEPLGFFHCRVILFRANPTAQTAQECCNVDGAYATEVLSFVVAGLEVFCSPAGCVKFVGQEPQATTMQSARLP